jgi:hypothetical protein
MAGKVYDSPAAALEGLLFDNMTMHRCRRPFWPRGACLYWERVQPSISLIHDEALAVPGLQFPVRVCRELRRNAR